MSEQPSTSRKKRRIDNVAEPVQQHLLMTSRRRPRRRRKRGGSDRVVLDVGGESFLTTQSTLCSDSNYFRAVFSSRWQQQSEDDSDNDDGNSDDKITNQQHSHEDNSNDDDDEYYYLDQNPESFRKLLEYMRLGMIPVEQLTQHSLLLADFLGMDTLLTAVKVQTIMNMEARGSSSSDDDDDEAIVKRFDEMFGGLRVAISNGLLPKTLQKPSQNYVKQEYANLTIAFATSKLTITSEIEGLERVERQPFLSFALNVLGRHGFNDIVSSGSLGQTNDASIHDIIFIRTVPVHNDTSSATRVLINNNNNNATAAVATTTLWKRKQYAVLYRLASRGSETITLAVNDDETHPDPPEGEIQVLGGPGQVVEDDHWSQISFRTRNRRGMALLFQRGYNSREKLMEKRLRPTIDRIRTMMTTARPPDDVEIRIYSREI